MASKWNTIITVWVEMVSAKKCWFSHAISGFFRERRDPAGILARQKAAQMTRFFGCQQLVQIRKIKVSVEHNLNRLSSFPCALVPSTLNCFPALSGETLTTSQIFIYFNTELIVLC